MITLRVTRIYELNVEPEWFEGAIEGEIAVEKIAEFYTKNRGLLSEALEGCEILNERIEYPSAG